ncbi:hypothetical protein SEEN554_21625 [Salmonella enterica subsp. enterica serovar Newport str. CVM 21554]|nr:hypothetical protein SEEN554_21625 [Salmonella enterica subsp. enterica serovar Newport str. CVM 21554]
MFKTAQLVFAGLVTLADWMGSDESQFPLLSSAMPLKDYWPLACEKAQQAILRMPPLSQHSHYQDHRALFPFIQTLTLFSNGQANWIFQHPVHS